MTFPNEKKTFLAKKDKSKKGTIDEQIRPVVDFINAHKNYYTTSSCAGRVYLWKGTGKKNQTEWIKVSHDLIQENFLNIKEPGLIWLRLEPFILHIACRDLESATSLVDLAHTIYKKSCLLSASNKILVEIRGSEFLEMPLYNNSQFLFAGSKEFLVSLINQKMKRMEEGRQRFQTLLKDL
ncbi:hypothetical protein HYU22_00965 [Candidatus Woesearchaeota archaeon]|nr:hypothetical protein [Candidatus Woesearchaeota archaeon]